jgi:hypothetical protein
MAPTTGLPTNRVEVRNPRGYLTYRKDVPVLSGLRVAKLPGSQFELRSADNVVLGVLNDEKLVRIMVNIISD